MFPINNAENAPLASEKGKVKKINKIDQKTRDVFAKSSLPFRHSQIRSQSSVSQSPTLSNYHRLVHEFSSKKALLNSQSVSLVGNIEQSVNKGALSENVGKAFFLSLLIKSEEYAPEDSQIVINSLLVFLNNHELFRGEKSEFDPLKIKGSDLTQVVKEFESQKTVVSSENKGEKIEVNWPEKIPKSLALKKWEQELELVLTILDYAEKAISQSTDSKQVESKSISSSPPTSSHPKINRSAPKKEERNETKDDVGKKQSDPMQSTQSTMIKAGEEYVARMEEKKDLEKQFDEKREVEKKNASVNERKERNKPKKIN